MKTTLFQSGADWVKWGVVKWGVGGGGGRGVVLALQNEFIEIFIYSLFEDFC